MSTDRLFDASDARIMTHIYPMHDLRPHDTESGKCWCNPEHDEEHMLIIHNSMDERESYEEGRKPT